MTHPMRHMCAALLLLVAAAAHAQRAQYITYGTAEGLVQSQVRAIAQDSRGYLWIGTLGGLSRFDGKEFRTYSKDDGLPDNQINALLQAKDQFWIGSTGALSYVEGRYIRNIALPAGFENSRVFTLAQDAEGAIWAGLAGDGLLRYHQGNFTHFGTEQGLPDGYVRKVYQAPNGQLWIGTRSGTVLWNGQAFIPTPHPLLNEASISDILHTTRGWLLATTFEDGLLALRGDTLLQLRTAQGTGSDLLRAVAELPDGRIWLGSANGIAVLKGNDLSALGMLSSLPYSNIKCFGQDREGMTWIGTDGQGFFRRAGRAFASLSTSEGLCSDLVMQFAQRTDGTYAFATYDQGVCIWKDGSGSPHLVNETLPSKTVWQMKPHPDGSLWLGTSQGLVRYTDATTMVVSSADGLPGSRVTAIAFGESPAEKETVYAGTDKGLALLDTKGRIVQTFGEQSGFAGRRIRTLVPQRDAIWIGAEGSLYKKEKDAFRSWPIPEDAPIYCLAIDADECLWIGTSNGLYALARGAQTPVPVAVGGSPAGRHTNFLLTLPDQSLLVGTNNGLYRINLMRYHREGRLQVKHYGAYEGLKSLETNQNAVYFDGAYVWFGTAMGAVRFDPAADNYARETAPALLITGVQLYLQEPNWDEIAPGNRSTTGLPLKPKLRHNQNYLTFEYTGIYLSNPDKVKYVYKLDGADEDWLGPTRNRSATYAYLRHGQYTFRVKTWSENDPEKYEEASFAFVILPPFYLTWWFFTLCGAAIALLAWAIYTRRVRKEREKRESLRTKYQSRLLELESQSLNSSMNRHFIFNALNSIQYYINMQDRRSANKYLTSFARLIRKNLDSSQQNETRLDEELERLQLYLSLEQMRFQGRFSYRIEIDPNVDTSLIPIPAMMLQPFLENSIWHGILPEERHGEITIHISDEGTHYHIVIDDNGIGVDASLASKRGTEPGHTSQGMQLTQNRIDLYRRLTGLQYEVHGPAQRYDDQGRTTGTRVLIKLPKTPITTETRKNLTAPVEI